MCYHQYYCYQKFIKNFLLSSKHIHLVLQFKKSQKKLSKPSEFISAISFLKLKFKQKLMNRIWKGNYPRAFQKFRRFENLKQYRFRLKTLNFVKLQISKWAKRRTLIHSELPEENLKLFKKKKNCLIIKLRSY